MPQKFNAPKLQRLKFERFPLNEKYNDNDTNKNKNNNLIIKINNNIILIMHNIINI